MTPLHLTVQIILSYSLYCIVQSIHFKILIEDRIHIEVWLLVFTFSIYLLAVVVYFFNCFVGRAPLLRRGSNIITPPMPGFCCSDIVWLLLQTPSGSSVLGPRGNFERPLFFCGDETTLSFFLFLFLLFLFCFYFCFVCVLFCFVLVLCLFSFV